MGNGTSQVKHLMRSILLPFLLALSLPAFSQTGGWRDQDGNAVPDSDSMKSKSGFAASVVITTDEDWKEKWETPPETIPSFQRAEDIPYGKRVFILLFFANPAAGPDGQARIKCDLRIMTPLGKVSFEQKDMACFAGRIAGDPTNAHLSAPVVGFSGDPGDPLGTWTVEATLRDEIRNVELPLKASFNLLREPHEQTTEWPELPTREFVSGRPATQQDVQEGRAIFVLTMGDTPVGKPIAIEIPQFALLNAGDGKPPVPVVVVQAEEFPKGQLAGVRDATGKEYAVFLTDLQLLGTRKPAENPSP